MLAVVLLLFQQCFTLIINNFCGLTLIEKADFSLQEARQRAARRTKNLQAYVDWFNRLSYLVATTVCQKKKKKLRVKIIEFWIEVARECVNIGNFNSLMGIITGLNMIPVARLKRTWLKIQSAGKFAVLEHQVKFRVNSI